MSTKICINLPVKDLGRSTDFFTKLGFSLNPQLSGENMGCLVISDDIYVMLLVESYFKTLTKKDIVNATSSAEAILQLRVESRQRVDKLVDKALAVGGCAGTTPTTRASCTDGASGISTDTIGMCSLSTRLRCRSRRDPSLVDSANGQAWNGIASPAFIETIAPTVPPARAGRAGDEGM